MKSAFREGYEAVSCNAFKYVDIADCYDDVVRHNPYKTPDAREKYVGGATACYKRIRHNRISEALKKVEHLERLRTRAEEEEFRREW